MQSVQKTTWNDKNPNKLLQLHSESLRDFISVVSKIRGSLLVDKSIAVKNTNKKNTLIKDDAIRQNYFL